MVGESEKKKRENGEKKGGAKQSIQPPSRYVYVVVWQGLLCQLSTEKQPVQKSKGKWPSYDNEFLYSSLKQPRYYTVLLLK